MDNYYMTSRSMAGPRADPVLLVPAGLYAYNTQIAYEITLAGSAGTTHLYLGDQWNAPALGASTYALYPLTLNDSSGLSIAYTTGYRLDTQAGTWTALPATAIITAQLLAQDGSGANAATVECATCASGRTVDVAAAGGFSFTSPRKDGETGDKVLQFHYTYATGKQEWKQLVVAVDGVERGSALLQSSRDAHSYFDAGARLAGLAVGSTVELRLPDVSGAVVLVTSVDVYAVDA